MDEEILQNVRDALLNDEAADLLVESPDGNRRLMLIPSHLWKGKETELLIVLESYGSIFYKPGDTLTAFKLLAHGFPFHIAGKIVELFLALFPPPPALPVCRTRRHLNASSTQPHEQQ